MSWTEVSYVAICGSTVKENSRPWKVPASGADGVHSPQFTVGSVRPPHAEQSGGKTAIKRDTFFILKSLWTMRTLDPDYHVPPATGRAAGRYPLGREPEASCGMRADRRPMPLITSTRFNHTGVGFGFSPRSLLLYFQCTQIVAKRNNRFSTDTAQILRRSVGRASVSHGTSAIP